MNWLKFIQRIFAISAIFIIWIVVFRYTMNVEKEYNVRSTELPDGTLGFIQVNTPKLSKSLIFEFAFNNKDPRILKIVSEYWQNLAQDTSNKEFPIDLNQSINLIKVKQHEEIFWILSGTYKKVDKGIKPECGFIKNNRYYWIINSNSTNYVNFKKKVLRSHWFTFSSEKSGPMQYHLISQRALTNSYNLDLSINRLTITYKPTNRITSVNTPKSENYFHLTTSLNRGSFIPEKYVSYQKLLESLSGLSINYYGAKYIDDDSGPSYIEPQFDLLLSFAKKTNPSEIFPLLKELVGDDLRYSDQRLHLNGSKYHFYSCNDSTIYVGKNRMNVNNLGSTFAMMGKPEMITEISNLGWKAGVLELIPEYRALKEFSQAIASVNSKSDKQNQTLSIEFKPGVNAQLESFLMVLTLVNAYQF